MDGDVQRSFRFPALPCHIVVMVFNRTRLYGARSSCFAFKRVEFCFGEFVPGPIDVKSQHRHRGSKRIAFSAGTAISGTF